jgi:L-type amino acid transporter 9
MASSETTPLIQDEPASHYVTDEDNTESTAVSTGTFARNLGALDGFGLLISIVIGSGVFSSPGPIDADVPSPGAGLMVWLVGGILAWTGALTMAELGTAFPGEGGIQPYLSYIYGDFWGYMAAWSWVVATMPATLAILSIVFVESIYSSLGVNEPAPPITHKLLSLLVLICVTTLNSISTKTSTRLSSFFVAVKLLTILLLIVAGLVVVFVFVGKGKDYGGDDWHRKGWFAPRDTVLPDGTHFDWTKVTLWESLGFYSTALYGALWAYSGWDKVCTTSPEIGCINQPPGKLRGCRASRPKQATSSVYQHRDPHHYPVLCCRKRRLLHSPALGSRVDNGCRCSRKLLVFSSPLAQ